MMQMRVFWVFVVQIFHIWYQIDYLEHNKLEILLKFLNIEDGRLKIPRRFTGREPIFHRVNALLISSRVPKWVKVKNVLTVAGG